MPPAQDMPQPRITLSSLAEMGFLAAFDPPTGQFDPHGDWAHGYLIFGLSGWEPATKLGFLKVSRHRAPDAPCVTLTVEKRLAMLNARTHRTCAEMTCACDAMCSLISWSVQSCIVDEASGESAGGLPAEETGRVDDQTLHIDTRGRGFTRSVRGPVTADWCLVDVVQRLPFDQGAHVELAVLEELEMLQQRRQLSYAGVETLTTRGGEMALHRYSQPGHGVSPSDFWVDCMHRLVVAVSDTNAYVLDPTAEAAWPSISRDFGATAGR